jgi:hypothetical protein
MATKKVKDALASTTTPDQILAAAGVEVKLTKIELAEYVKELAIRELDKQYEDAVEVRDAAEGKIGWGGEEINVDGASIPARVRRIREAMQENDVVIRGIDLYVDGEAIGAWRIAYENGRGVDFIRIPHKEGDYQIPSKYVEYVALKKRVDDIRDKRHEIKNKNFKVLMIENALMSTDAGKMLVTNLQQMVKNLTTI